jgi:membrane protein
MNLKSIWDMLKATFKGWSEDKASMLAAALAFYTVFSLAPLLVIATAIAGLAFGDEAVRDLIISQVTGLIGPVGAEAIQTMMVNAPWPGKSMATAAIGVITLLVGASGAFVQLKNSLNIIWGVKEKEGEGLFGFIRRYFFSFGMIVSSGFLLLISLIINAILAAFGDYIGRYMIGYETILYIFNFALSFVIITVIFALMFKLVPDATIAWKDVWIGAAATSLLFSLGKFLIGLYLGHSAVGSSYGAASSLVIFMLWIYYSAQVFLLGAEFTRVYSERFGSKIKSEKSAVYTKEGPRDTG